MALLILYGVDSGIDTTKLSAVSRLVEEASGVKLQPHKAIAGGNAFAHESGTVVAGLLKEPFAAEAYTPNLVGQVRQIALGKKSGAASIDFKLSQLGLRVTEKQRTELLKRVKAESIAKKASIPDSRFQTIVAELISSS